MLSYLVLLKPLFQELLPALLQDRTCELYGLKMIEFALLQEDAEVLEDGRETARRRRCLFE